MAGTTNHTVLILEILLLHFVLPALIALLVSYILRKAKIIKDGDMKLQEQ